MDAAGSTTAVYSYEPFGASTVAGGSSNSFTFTGRETDGTGLMYYRARYYSPGMQRFISQDPLGFGGGDVNLYAYVGNGPTNGTDPTGLCPWCLFLGFAALGAIIDLNLQAWNNNRNGGGCIDPWEAIGAGMAGALLLALASPWALGGAFVFFLGASSVVAEQYAVANGSSTVGMTWAGQLISSLSLSSNLSNPLWMIMSIMAAIRATSAVVLVGPGASAAQQGIFMNIELPLLLLRGIFPFFVWL